MECEDNPTVFAHGPYKGAPMDQSQRLAWLIDHLIAENPQLTAASGTGELTVPADEEARFRLYRSLVNIRPPRAVDAEYLRVEDAYLQKRRLSRGTTVAEDLPVVRNGIALWRGDITTLAADAIVNAANSQMLGCFSPCHGCIDNAIHTAAGIRLRLACDELMRIRAERLRTRAPLIRRRDTSGFPTGEALLTPGFNLPASDVIHTVGPIVTSAAPTAKNRADLARCYHSCLDIACEKELSSIVFCCISTGEFRYPNREAAQIAIDTVITRQKQAAARGMPFPMVVFNVFKDLDLRIYQDLLAS